MPKRKYNDKIERYHKKIRRLEQKELRRRSRIVDSDSSNSNENSDHEQAQNIEVPEIIVQDDGTENLNGEASIHNLDAGPNQDLEPTPELSSDVLAALGDALEDTPRFGKNIHDSLARLWRPILTKGLDKDNRDKLIKENPIPENCPLLQAPKLNPEILAAVSDSIRVRDKRVESVQQQLGAGITALNRGLELLLDDDSSRLQAVKHLSDCCRLLCDLHHIESEARKKFVTPSLDKSFTSIIQAVDRDELLFGNKLSEKIKASKVIEKQGLQIKRIPTNIKPTTPSAPVPSTSRSQPQGNWRGPPRYPPSSRGNRGGPKKTGTMGHRKSVPGPQLKTSYQPKHRAPQ